LPAYSARTTYSPPPVSEQLSKRLPAIMSAESPAHHMRESLG
jgi:hypothetical protein